MKFQIASDLHINFSENYLYLNNNFHASCDNLIVAGDLADWHYKKTNKFFDTVLSDWKNVYLVYGNHDFYHGNADCEQMQYMNFKFKNVNFLNSAYIDLPEVRIIGTTLWSNVVSDAYSVRTGMNDYIVIKDFTIDKNNEIHRKSVEFLDKALESTPKTAIVVTHHMPLFYLIQPSFKNSPLSEAYASNLTWLIEKHFNKISNWVYGHTHSYDVTNILGVNFIRNPLGYLRCGEGKQFNCSYNIET